MQLSGGSPYFTKPLKFAIDTLSIIVSFFLVYYLRMPLQIGPLEHLGPIYHYSLLLFISIPIWWTNLLGFRIYSNRILEFRKRLFFFLQMAICVLLCISLTLFLFQKKDFNRTIVIPFVFLSSGMMLLWRVLLREILTVPIKRLLLVGNEEELREVSAAIQKPVPQNLEIAGFVSHSPLTIEMVPYLGNSSELFQVLRKNVIDEVVFAMPLSQLEENRELLSVCKMLGINAFALSRIHEERMDDEVQNFFGLPFLSFPAAPLNSPAFVIKAVLDRLIAMCGMILLSPVMLLIALLIKISSEGPVLFIQERVGLNGRKFHMYKFRTMVTGAQEQRELLEAQNEMSGPVFKMKKDPRVTTVGKYLRRFSLDELPNLWNVLIGDMSLVGPRPLPLDEMDQIPAEQRRRISVKPGITCLWQSKGRNEIDYHEWMALDLQYIDNWSLWLDLKILVSTCGAVVLAKGAS
ncbi:MAG: hypothetical protein C5B54_08380 [Acidobacteria bacterium]|nr:MAG: hypothetical protein C5B54_08380 [Acidobacteriota bacterium]